jgi:putative restriction endonuclease
VTIRPDHRLAVSSALREDYENGRSYYQLDGQRILLPRNAADLPDPEFLDWHAASVLRA